MEKFQTIRSIAVPWLMPNVDTDTISPMKRLILNMDELDVYSFEPYRFRNGDGDAGELDPDFPLNQPRYRGAKILIAGENFGCGSSRETAPEAIRKCGYRCVIAVSFGGIFTKNCYQQGLLPITFPKELVLSMARQAEEGGEFVVDLEGREVTSPDGKVHPFTIDETRREALLQGLDEVRRTLLREEEIRAFWAADRLRRPWLEP